MSKKSKPNPPVAQAATALFWENNRSGLALPSAYHIADTARELPLSDVWISRCAPGELGTHRPLRIGTLWVCDAPRAVYVWAGDHWSQWYPPALLAHPLLPSLVLLLQSDGAPVWAPRDHAVLATATVVAMLLDRLFRRVIAEWCTWTHYKVQEKTRPPNQDEQPAMARQLKAHMSAAAPVLECDNARVRAAIEASTLKEKNDHVRHLYGRVVELQKEVAFLRATEDSLRIRHRALEDDVEQARVKAQTLQDKRDSLEQERDALLCELEGCRSVYGLLW